MPNSCLVVVDVQNDFCPGGALEVPAGDEVVPAVNRLIDMCDHFVLTQDWHPADHSSFASQHLGAEPMTSIQMSYGAQILWPDHCIQDTIGAKFHPGLNWVGAEMIVRKGFRRQIDSYSAFFENDHETPTGLGGYLKERGFAAVTLCGLATDFCVGFSALDAARMGFETTVVLDACRAIDVDGSLDAMLSEMRDAGVTIS